MSGAEPTRVAILGGGPAGVATAFELTATAELRERYEVTIHQLGWRLGGKCASGRNTEYGNRIEEHGLHLWFGFYDNGFELMRRCYDELGRHDGSPLRTVEEAFHQLHSLVLFDRDADDGWIGHQVTLPGNDLTAGDAREFTFGELCAEVLGRLVEHWTGPLGDRHSDLARAGVEPEHHAHLPAWAERIRSDIGVALEDLERSGRAHALQLAHHLAQQHADGEPPGPPRGRALLLPKVLGLFKGFFDHDVVRERMDVDDELRFFFQGFDLCAAVITGIVRDGIHGPANDVELRTWLLDNGADEDTVRDSPILRALYDLVFGFEEGDPDRPNLAAGKAVQALIRIGLTYKGSVLYKMQAGMGDTVFSPMYEVLRRRGVQFRFFEWVTAIDADAAGDAIASFTIQHQARVRDGNAYDPLIDVKGLPCWPSAPDFDQLVDGDVLRDGKIDLERVADPLGLKSETRRRGDDFDVVVLAIPIAAIEALGGDFVDRNERLATMLANAHTVTTQAFQLWLDTPIGPELGWEHDQHAVAGAYVEPLDTFCNMTQLLAREEWSYGIEPRGCAYFCGPLPHDGGGSADEADALVRAAALDYLRRHVGGLWPGAVSGDGALEWARLIAPADAHGEERFAVQYARANWEPSSRYVMTPAGSVRHRLRSGESGYDNLVLAGDWTRNGLCGGAVEAAVTSGRMASQAISGSPAEIPGLDGWLERDE